MKFRHLPKFMYEDTYEEELFIPNRIENTEDGRMIVPKDEVTKFLLIEILGELREINGKLDRKA